MVRVAGFEFPTLKVQHCYVGLFFLKMPLRKPFLNPFLPICHAPYEHPLHT